MPNTREGANAISALQGAIKRGFPKSDMRNQGGMIRNPSSGGAVGGIKQSFGRMPARSNPRPIRQRSRRRYARG